VPTPPLHDEIARALTRYEQDDNLGVLLDTLRTAARKTDLDTLLAAAETFRERPEAAIPLYERITAERPNDARALVALANAYWITGRGPDVVGELADRARAADPANRAAWHLWALAQPNIRDRVQRWTEVTHRFPEDQLARAALADNATSLAGAEHDPVALELAISTYEQLLADTQSPTQRRALEQALTTLRNWTL
jgi:hypothetical protein